MSTRSLMLFLFCGILLAGCSETENDWPNSPFVKSEWREASEAERYVYVNDLLSSSRLIGRSQEEVVELLGSPSSKNSDEDRYFYIVKLGGDGFDQVFLLDIKFGGTNNIVEEAFIRGD